MGFEDRVGMTIKSQKSPGIAVPGLEVCSRIPLPLAFAFVGKTVITGAGNGPYRFG
jgi:hypothetical protein